MFCPSKMHKSGYSYHLTSLLLFSNSLLPSAIGLMNTIWPLRCAIDLSLIFQSIRLRGWSGFATFLGCISGFLHTKFGFRAAIRICLARFTLTFYLCIRLHQRKHGDQHNSDHRQFHISAENKIKNVNIMQCMCFKEVAQAHIVI